MSAGRENVFGGKHFPEGMPPGSQESLSILLIEEDGQVRCSLAMVLAGWGCAVLAEPSVEEVESALQARHFRPDIIIADIKLGACCQDTLNAVTTLTERISFAGAVILTTGDSSKECRGRVQSSGWPLLLKPFTAADLRAAFGAARLPA